MPGMQQFGEVYAFNANTEVINAIGLNPSYLSGPGNVQLRFDTVWLSNNDASDHIVDVTLLSSSFSQPLGSVNVPAGSGFGGLRCVEALSSIFGTGSTGMCLMAGDQLGFAVEVIMPGATVLGISGLGGTM